MWRGGSWAHAARGVVRLYGADTLGFLQGLLTNDTRPLEAAVQGAAVSPLYAALLTPQGRFLYDGFFFSRTSPGAPQPESALAMLSLTLAPVVSSPNPNPGQTQALFRRPLLHLHNPRCESTLMSRPRAAPGATREPPERTPEGHPRAHPRAQPGRSHALTHRASARRTRVAGGVP